MKEKGEFISLGEGAVIVCIPSSVIEGFPQRGVYIIRGASSVAFIPFPMVKSYVFTIMGQLGLNRNQSLHLESILTSMDGEVTASLKPLARVSNTNAKRKALKCQM